MNKKILVICTTDSMIWNFLIPHIIELKKDGYDVLCACSRTGIYFDELVNDYGFTVFHVDFERTPYSWRNIRALFQLNKIVRNNDIGTVFCHEPVGGAVGRIVGAINNCSVLYMAHGFHFYLGAPRSSIIYYYVEKLLSRFTDVLITINQEDYKASTTFHAKENVLIPGIGVDISAFDSNRNPDYLKKQLCLSDDDIVLLSVGELIKRKNHETIILALKNSVNPHLHYVIAGDGSLFDYYNELIVKSKLNNVHLLGFRRDISELCNSSDIFVFPSFQEGLSVALMEAMACGLPVIASNIRGNSDLIDNNLGGYLINVSDGNAYLNAIDDLVDNADKRKAMGSYNKEKVKDYSIETVIERLVPLVEKYSN